VKRFSYKALDAKGKFIDGFMDAASIEEVGTWLADRQFQVLEISASSLGEVYSAARRKLSLSPREMNFFLLQLSSLINAGCPLVQCLGALQRQAPQGSLKIILGELKDKIEMGKSFSEALKSYPEVFSNLFITMVEVGEIGGILDQVMERYSKIYESLFLIRAKILKSMIYPAILLTLTVGVAWALLVWVFPLFIEQIEGRGGILPGPTRVVLYVSQTLVAFSNYFFAIPRMIPLSKFLVIPLYLTFVLSFAWVLLKKLLGLPLTRKIIDDFLIHAPIIGRLFRQIELTLFSRTLGTLIKCGVPILTSLTAVEKALGNYVFKNALGEIRLGVSKGESLSYGMIKRRDLFPESLILMADVGERGGNVGDLMEKAADFFERDLETTIDTVVSLIEPALVIFLSIFVVTLALAMYLPLFDIIKMVK